VTSSLSTARLQLSAPTRADAAAILAIAGNPRAVAHNPSDLLTDLAEAQELLDRWIRHWMDRGFGYWCVREVGRPRVIGYCGLKAVTVKGLSVLNLIYRFTPDVWGRGYATEAATAAIAWGTAHQPSTLILARVRPDNLASQNVALKVGLRRDHGMDDEGEDGQDLAYTTRPRTIEWVQLELSTDIALPASSTLPAGVSLVSIAELGDTEQLRRRVYELNKELCRRYPGRGEFFSYDEYIQRRFAADGYQPEGSILALDGVVLVGLCVISYVPGRDWAFIEMTGVRRSHRRRGLATALKTAAIRQARGWGVSTVRTVHHRGNTPIITANRVLGFVDTNFMLNPGTPASGVTGSSSKP
jgi:ribosomal-protein-alanine N-acetyltransferase